MRPKQYLSKDIITGEVTAVPFDSSHYKEAGVPASISAGMPVLEAYELVNKWNINQTNQRWIYAIA